MTPDEESLLRDIGVLLLGNLAGFTAMTLVYGVFVLFFCIACYKVITRGLKSRTAIVILIVSVITFCIATVYWCAYLASFATLVRGILVDTDIGPLDTNGSYDGINHKNLRFSRMQSWTAQLLPMITDAVLVSRVRVMYPTKPWIMIVPILLLAGTIGSGFGLLGVISTEPFDITVATGASALWKKMYISYMSLSLATNVICALLILFEVLRLQKVRPGHLGHTVKVSSNRLVMITLLETGILYAICQVINLALELVKPPPDSSLYFAAIVITSIYAVCAGMYPTITIHLVTVQRSLPHLYGLIPIELKPTPAAAKNATGARPATAGHLVFAPAGTQHVTSQITTATSVPSSQVVSILLPAEKAKTLTDSLENIDEKGDDKHTRTAPF